MGNKIRFTMHNHVDLSTTTMGATNSVATLPIDNVQLVPRSKLWRSTGTATNTITSIFPAQTTISSVTLGRHNLTAGCTYQVQLWSGSLSGSVHLSAAIPISAEEGYEPASDLEYQDLRNATWWAVDANGDKVVYNNVRSISVTITLAGGSNSFFEVGRLIAGDFIEPTYNLSYGHTLGFDEKTKQFRTASGTLRSDVALPYKKFDFNLKTISEADRGIMQAAFADVGMRKDFFLSVFPDAGEAEKQIDYSAIMKLKKVPRFTEFQDSWYRAKYSMEEV